MAKDGAVPVPAATVIPLRDGGDGLEVLMLRRNSRGEFGGMWVFPGGQVDDSDGTVDDWETEEEWETLELVSARQAAVREAREEAGIELQPADLVWLSFWMPPVESARRFATWFFLAPPVAPAPVTVDQTEIKEHRWLTPQAAIANRREGGFELAPPTFTTLWWLKEFPDAESALAAARDAVPGRFETHLARNSSGGLGATLWAGDAGYEDSDMYRPGPRRRLIMDEDDWRVEIDI